MTPDGPPLGFDPARMPVAASGGFWTKILARLCRGLDWLEYAYLLRFSIAAGLALAIVLPVLFKLAPSIFVGLFDARGEWSLMFIAWIAWSLTWTVMVTSRLVLVYAQDRYPDLPPIAMKKAGAALTLLYALLAAPLLAVACHGSSEIQAGQKAVALSLGFLLSIAMLFLSAGLHFSIEPKGRATASKVYPSFWFLESSAKPVGDDSRSRSTPNGCLAGIVENGRLRSGHVMAAALVGLLLVVYTCMGVYYMPGKSVLESQPAALFYALFLITLLTWMFSGFAFFLDRFRIPVLTSVLALSFIGGFARTDHEFAVVPAPGDQKGADLSPRAVIDQWTAHRGGTAMPITVVATSGGGIQAAGWTAVVLTHLADRCPAFGSSLVLVSSVSGGSAGTLYFVDGFDANGQFATDQDANIRANAMRSSLSAVGWGLLYPDFLRTIPGVDTFVRQTDDRGWALENAWTTGWAAVPHLSDWRKDVSHGVRPAVIFNSTVSETGQRFAIATTDIDYPPASGKGGTIQFSDAYKGWDLPVSTAARVSAAFPYVSPISRPSQGGDKPLHFADGGYYDNSGVLAAIEWLHDAGDDLKGHRVLFVTIDETSEAEKQKGGSWSWQRQLVAPIETLVSTRSSSQSTRDSLESTLAVEALSIITPVTSVKFDFVGQGSIPLSWHLTPQQEQEIENYWGAPGLRSAKDDAGGLLGCTID